MSCLWRSVILLLMCCSANLSFASDEQEQIFYTVLHETSLKVKHHLNGDEQEHRLVSGMSFLWIEQQADDDGQLWFRLGLEAENFTALEEQEIVSAISEIWVRAEDFYKLDLLEDVVTRMTYCYRYVKKYLLKKGFVDTYLPGASAYMAATILPQHGFTKSKRTPLQAKTYDVCVYKGGPSGHGHIEVRDPQGWYYGYGYKKQPIQNRTFLGCFFKLLKN